MAWERSGVPGGGAVRTSWFDRDLPAMWRVLENQQSDDHWRLVAGWRKAAELTATHLRRLEHYRTTLAEVWPPDRNAAAAAYVARLDFLIQNVRTTHDVAAANYSTLAATVGALAAARRDLKPLHDEYVAKSRAIKDHANLVALNAAAEAPTVIGAAPASAQDLERLNNRGRAIMYTLSHTLVEAEAAIRQPPTYPSRPYLDQGNPDVYGSNGRNTIGRKAYGRPTLDEPEHRSDRLGADTVAKDLTSSPGDGTPAFGAPSSGHRSAPSTWDADRSSARGGAQQNETVRQSRVFTERQSNYLRPGGIIGGQYAAHESSPTRPLQRINPVGGVIGGQSATAMNPTHPPAVPPMYGVDRGRQETRRRQSIDRYGPDTIWETPEGVPSVITPRQEQGQFDPGPVIGLNQ